MRTPTQALADMILGKTVEDWITERRDAGISWRKIALELRDVTGGQIDVAPPTLIAWDAARVAA